MPILDLIYPRRCAGCQRVGNYFCGSCLSSTRIHLPQICPVCEHASSGGVKHKMCGGSWSPDGLFVIWRYKGVPRKLIGKLKYKFISEIASSLSLPASNLLKRVRSRGRAIPNWSRDKLIIVPMPLYRTRKNWRGFNQTEKVAAFLAGEMGWEMVPLLARKKGGKAQVGLKAGRRAQNVKGVFEVNRKYLPLVSKSKPIVLFDDVWTTGSTMKEAVKVLKGAGVKRVWCLVLAR